MAADKFRPHHPEELEKLLSWCEGANSILEIGSRYGFVLMDLARRSNAKRVVSVDLPNVGDWGNDSEETLKNNIQALKEEGRDAHLFLGDSKDPDIIQKVKSLGPYDFIFIDGDHRYEGVCGDWRNYGLMGDAVVFHDIVQPKPGERQSLEVWRLWEIIKQIYDGTDCITEFIGKDSKMGIGRVVS